MIGKVKAIKKGGYGFIIDENGEEYFFHMSQCVDWDRVVKLSPPNTEEGPPVLFRPIEHKRGPRAEKVELI